MKAFEVFQRPAAQKGKVFSGWYDGAYLLSQSANFQFIMSSTDLTLTAKFVEADDDKNPANIDVTLYTEVDSMPLSHNASQPLDPIHWWNGIAKKFDLMGL